MDYKNSLPGSKNPMIFTPIKTETNNQKTQNQNNYFCPFRKKNNDNYLQKKVIIIFYIFTMLY